MKNNKKPEILAPVGGAEQLKAAVRCGADAVYFGTKNFNARRNADNFGSMELKEAVDYCHLRNVKVYITLNTLVFDRELQELANTVAEIAASGADAVIVQDFAAAEYVRKICPALPLHASTQMAVRNAAGAKFLEKLGFSRIVLAREMSLKEIEDVCRSVGIETEVFIHGAHCMSASGNCYLSSALGERSGNRGLCAQGCRLDWISQHKKDHALSLKDMSYLDSLDKLCEAGVDSLKIEGRMKRPEYVAAAVTSTKQALNGQNYDKELLKNVFSRSGFTDGYLKAKTGADMFGFRSKDDVVASSSEVFKSLSALYNREIHPLSVDFELILSPDMPSVLNADCGGVNVTAGGAVPQVAIKAPLSEEIAARNLSKLGETPFSAKECRLINEAGLTLSAGEINALRRDAVSLLEKALLSGEREITPLTVPERERYIPSGEPEIRIRLQSASQFSSKFPENSLIILDIDEIINNPKMTGKARFAFEIPYYFGFLPEKARRDKLNRMKELNVLDAAVSNIGDIEMLKDYDFILHGTHTLNITNTPALEAYRGFGLSDTALSFEMNGGDIAKLGGRLKRGSYVYGHLPLMIMRSCPQKSKDGCRNCSGSSFLTDRKGKQFPVLCHNREYSVLHNCIPLYVGDKKIPPLDFYELYFTVESKEYCEYICNSFQNREVIDKEKTNGSFFKELL